MTEKTLRDVADKVIPLEKLFFPEKKKCAHIIFDDFFVKTLDGCILRCANCGAYVAHKCSNCTLGEIVTDPSGFSYFVLPCDAIKIKKSK